MRTTEAQPPDWALGRTPGADLGSKIVDAGDWRQQARILIVDDLLSNIELLVDMLLEEGYTRIRSITDSRQIFQVCKEFQPDLILLDLMMPHLSGIQVLEQLLPQVPSGTYLPILVLTADATADTKHRALAAGARDFLAKPLDPDEVLLRIRNLLETRFLYLEQQRHASEEIHVLAQLVDQAREAIVIRDLGGRVLSWNRGAASLYGWTAAEAQGRDLGQLLFPEGSTEFEEAVTITMRQGAWAGELRPMTRDRVPRDVESRWSLASDAGGRPRAILVIDADITDRKRMECQLLRAQRMESIGILAGGIAHDLNNVMTPLMIGLSLLRDEVEEPGSEKASIIDDLEACVQRGASLVRQILTFARGANGDIQPLTLRPLINEFTKILGQTFLKGIEIRTDLAHDLKPVDGDPTQIHQVLMNLAVNARDAMPEGGELTLSARNVEVDATLAAAQAGAHPGPHVMIAIRDTGCGIAPDLMNKLFEPFFTTKDQGKGTGLGLTIASRIVKSLGGFIEVESQVHVGTEFRVYLPVTHVQERPTPAGIVPPPRGKGERIMVVDDEASILQIVRAILEAHGYQVETATDGIEAVARFARSPQDFDAVLLDLVMPQMDGKTTLRTLQRLSPAVKVLLMSGLIEESRIEGPADQGERAFLHKPFSASQLLLRLQAVLADGVEASAGGESRPIEDVP